MQGRTSALVLATAPGSSACRGRGAVKLVGGRARLVRLTAALTRAALEGPVEEVEAVR